MDEKQKNHVMVGLMALALLFFITTLGSCGSAFRNKKMKDKEMATRIDLEEKVNKYTQQSESMQEKLKTLQQELSDEKAAHEATKKALVQEEMINKSLKEDVQKITKLNDALEQDLKKIIATGKSDLKK